MAGQCEQHCGSDSINHKPRCRPPSTNVPCVCTCLQTRTCVCGTCAQSESVHDTAMFSLMSCVLHIHSVPQPCTLTASCSVGLLWMAWERAAALFDTKHLIIGVKPHIQCRLPRKARKARPSQAIQFTPGWPACVMAVVHSAPALSDCCLPATAALDPPVEVQVVLKDVVAVWASQAPVTHFILHATAT
jgi:hypothetical protein